MGPSWTPSGRAARSSRVRADANSAQVWGGFASAGTRDRQKMCLRPHVGPWFLPSRTQPDKMGRPVGVALNRPWYSYLRCWNRSIHLNSLAYFPCHEGVPAASGDAACDGYWDTSICCYHCARGLIDAPPPPLSPEPARSVFYRLGRSSSSNWRRKPGAHHAGPPSSLLPAPAPLLPQVLGLQAPVPSLPVDDLTMQDTLPSLLPPVHGGLSGDGNGELTVQLGACSQPPTLSDSCTTAGCTGGPLATAVAPKLACTLVQPSASVSSALLPPTSAFSSRLHRGWSIAVMMLMLGDGNASPGCSLFNAYCETVKARE